MWALLVIAVLFLSWTGEKDGLKTPSVSDLS